MLMPLRCAFVVSTALPTTDFGPAAADPDTDCGSTAIIAGYHEPESGRQ